MGTKGRQHGFFNDFVMGAYENELLTARTKKKSESFENPSFETYLAKHEPWFNQLQTWSGQLQAEYKTSPTPGSQQRVVQAPFCGHLPWSIVRTENCRYARHLQKQTGQNHPSATISSSRRAQQCQDFDITSYHTQTRYRRSYASQKDFLRQDTCCTCRWNRSSETSDQHEYPSTNRLKRRGCAHTTVRTRHLHGNGKKECETESTRRRMWNRECRWWLTTASEKWNLHTPWLENYLIWWPGTQPHIYALWINLQSGLNHAILRSYSLMDASTCRTIESLKRKRTTVMATWATEVTKSKSLAESYSEKESKKGKLKKTKN